MSVFRKEKEKKRGKSNRTESYQTKGLKNALGPELYRRHRKKPVEALGPRNNGFRGGNKGKRASP